MTINSDFRYNKPSKEIIIDLIWYSSGLKLPPGMIEFGHPEAFEPFPNDSIGRNTVVATRGTIKESRYFKGEQRLRYRRLKLNELTPIDGREFKIDVFPVTTHEILTHFNYVYGVQLSHEDVVNELYDEDHEVVIRASKESLVWIDEITVLTPPQLVTVKNLNGFRKYDPNGLTEFFLDGFNKYQQ